MLATRLRQVTPVVGGAAAAASVKCSSTGGKRIQIAAADIPAHNYNKFSVFVNFKWDSVSSEQICARASVGGVFADTPWNMYYNGSKLQIFGMNVSGSFFLRDVVWAPTAGVWYNVLLHFDWTNATPADRLKIWINRTQQTLSGSTLSGSGNTATTQNICVGGGGTGNGNELNGVVYQFAFGDNVHWDINDVTDTSTDQTIDLTGLSGATLLWQGNTGNGIDYDLVQGASTWSAQGGASLVSDVPTGV